MNKLKFTKNLTFGSRKWEMKNGMLFKEGWKYRCIGEWLFNKNGINKISQKQQTDNLPFPLVKVARSAGRGLGKGGDSKAAFTLAEVLITLGVIGVVAAITLPALFTNITGYVNTKRQENIGQKVTKAMENMRAHGLLNTQYATTDAFVDELQKYLKISKRCDADHVADCWPTTIVTTGDGEEYEVSQAKTGKHLSLESESNNVGLVLADGAPIILNYNPKAPAIDVGSKVEWISGLPQYTTTVTGAIDFVMDVNGGKSPNSEKAGDKRDIRSFKSAKFSKANPCSKYPNSTYVEGIGCIKEGTQSQWYTVKTVCQNMGMNLMDLNGLETLYNKRDKYPEFSYLGTIWSSDYTDLNNISYVYWYGDSFSVLKRGPFFSYNSICVVSP